MSLHVLAEVIAAHEAVRADGAHELLLACVRAKVSRELVAARERLTAAVPLAHVGSLARVHTYVRLQVRALEVALVAARERTRVIAGLLRTGHRRRRLAGGRGRRRTGRRNGLLVMKMMVVVTSGGRGGRRVHGGACGDGRAHTLRRVDQVSCGRLRRRVLIALTILVIVVIMVILVA